MPNGTATSEHSLEISYKTELTVDPAIALLGIYPKKMKTYFQQKPAQRCL